MDVIKQKYILHKIYAKYVENSDIDTKELYSILLTNRDCILSSKAHFYELLPLRAILSITIVQPRKKEDYLFVLNILPLVLLESLKYVNQENFDDVLIEYLDNTDYDDPNYYLGFCDKIYTALRQSSCLDWRYSVFKDLIRLYPTFSQIYHKYREALKCS